MQTIIVHYVKVYRKIKIGLVRIKLVLINIVGHVIVVNCLSYNSKNMNKIQSNRTHTQYMFLHMDNHTDFQILFIFSFANVLLVCLCHSDQHWSYNLVSFRTLAYVATNIMVNSNCISSINFSILLICAILINKICIQFEYMRSWDLEALRSWNCDIVKLLFSFRQPNSFLC